MEPDRDEPMSETKSNFDLFAEALQKEEVFEEDSQAVREQQAADAMVSYQKLMGSFLQALPSGSLDNMEHLLQDFAERVRQLDDEVGGEAVPQGYVGHHIVAHLAVHLVKLLNSHLPRTHRLIRNNAKEFVMKFGTVLYPDIFDSSSMCVVRFKDLLSPESALRCMPVVTDDIEAELVLAANEQRMRIEEEWRALQAQDKLEPAKNEKTRVALSHTLDIMYGRFPPGFNTEHEERWQLVDVGTCLDPFYDPQNITHRLNARNIAYLQRLAKDMKNEIAELLETEPAAADHPTVIARAKRLDDFIEHGYLPPGWSRLNEAE